MRPIWTGVSARIEYRLQPVETAIGDVSRRLTSVADRLNAAELPINHIPVLERRLNAAELQTNHVPVLERRLNAAELETNHVPVLERRLAALEDGWRQHLPGLLNAISSVAAFGYELASLRGEVRIHSGSAEHASAEFGNLWKSSAQATKDIGELEQRIEFVCRKIMNEFGFGKKYAAPAVEKTARILSPDKVDRARFDGIRLNLGCGAVALDGYINVDQRDLPGIDIVSDAGNLPFETSSLREIFSAHLLERFPQEHLRRLLSYWRSLLAPDGTFRAVVPDGEAMLAAIASGTYPFEQFRETLFGEHEREGDLHLNLLTPDSLSRLLAEAGFSKIAVPVKGRRNGECFEFEIRASQ